MVGYDLKIFERIGATRRYVRGCSATFGTQRPSKTTFWRLAGLRPTSWVVKRGIPWYSQVFMKFERDRWFHNIDVKFRLQCEV
jgi:hypothetical protein